MSTSKTSSLPVDKAIDSDSSEDSIADYVARFERLRSQGVEASDRLGASVCASLLETIKSSRKASSHGRVLIRIKALLTQLEGKHQQNVERMNAQLVEIKQRQPDAYKEAVLLKQQGDFREVARLHAKVSRTASGTEAVRQLCDYLEQQSGERSVEAIGLDALLYDEELYDEALYGDGPEPSERASTEKGLQSLKSAQADDDALNELKSLQNYREYLGRVVTENMVRQVIKDDPENAGPLNPQRLLVRTLSAMKEVSPAYVNRLVPYFDTLLWLDEQAD